MRCLVCDEPINDAHSNRRVHEGECHRKHKRQGEQQRRAASMAARDVPLQTCAWEKCGKSFKPDNLQKKYCSETCKKNHGNHMYRRRLKARKMAARLRR